MSKNRNMNMNNDIKSWWQWSVEAENLAWNNKPVIRTFSFWNENFQKTRNQRAKSYRLSEASAANQLVMLRTDYILYVIQTMRTRSSYNPPAHHSFASNGEKCPGTQATWWASSVYYFLSCSLPPDSSLQYDSRLSESRGSVSAD